MRLLVLIIIILSIFRLNAQDFGRYFDYNQFTGEDIYEYEEVEFTWNMQGRIQVAFNEALNYLRENQNQASLIHLDSVIQMDSSRWMFFYYRGIVHHKLDNISLSISDLKKSINLNNTVPQTYAKLADVYFHSRAFKNAEDNYRLSVEVNPMYAMGFYKLGTVNLFQGQQKKAERYFEQALEINPALGAAHMMLGIMKFRVKKNDNVATNFFNKAIAVDSTYALAYFWRGLTNVSIEKLDETLLDWNQAVELSPNNAFLINMRGFLNFELKKYEDAFRDFRKIIMNRVVDEKNYRFKLTMLDKQLDIQFAINYMLRNSYGLPEEALQKIQKACCFLLTGDSKTALEDLRMAEKIEKSSSIYFLKALAFENLKRYDSALHCYNQALEIDNDIFDAHKKRAMYRNELKDWKGAYSDLKEMLRIQPNSLAAFRLSGLIKLDTKDYYGAIIDISKFIKRDTSDEETWRIRGLARQEVKDYKGAIQDYEMSLKINPEQKDLYFGLTWVYQLYGDTLNAIATMRSMKNHWKNDLTVKNKFIELLVLGKQYDSAIHYLRPIIKDYNLKTSFWNQDVYNDAMFLYGKTLVLSGSKEDGVKALNKCIQINVNHYEARLMRAKHYLETNQRNKALNDIKYLRAVNYPPASPLFSLVE